MKHEVDIPQNILEQVEDVKDMGKAMTKINRAKTGFEITKELYAVEGLTKEEYIGACKMYLEMLGIHL